MIENEDYINELFNLMKGRIDKSYIINQIIKYWNLTPNDYENDNDNDKDEDNDIDDIEFDYKQFFVPLDENDDEKKKYKGHNKDKKYPYIINIFSK